MYVPKTKNSKIVKSRPLQISACLKAMYYYVKTRWVLDILCVLCMYSIHIYTSMYIYGIPYI